MVLPNLDPGKLHVLVFGPGYGLADLQAHFEGGQTEQAVAAISDRWERRPYCRWTLAVGDTRPLGGASIEVLSPENDSLEEAYSAWRNHRYFDPNRVATALLLRWNDWRIVLGSDLVEGPSAGWSRALQRQANARSPAALKVPHHSSRNAFCKRLYAEHAGAEPVCVATPFVPSNLPNFDDGRGIELLHRHVRRVHLTGLPRAHQRQGGVPERYTRRQLSGMGSSLRLEPTTPGFPDCYVVTTFDASTVGIQHGPGTIEVTRSRRQPTKAKKKQKRNRGRTSQR